MKISVVLLIFLLSFCIFSKAYEYEGKGCSIEVKT